MQIIWDSLRAYIDSYDIVYYSTNGICSLIFLTSITALSRNFGVFDGILRVNKTCLEWLSTLLLLLSIAFCIATFVLNFYIQNYLAGFFKSIYVQKEIEGVNCCKWEKLDKDSLNGILEYYGNIQNEKIIGMVDNSIWYCVVSSVLIFAWFAIRVFQTIRSSNQ